MLKRAVASVLEQTYKNILVKVINDDPEDVEVANIIGTFNDSRISLFFPVEKRGATRNFNLVFSDPEATYVSILEDDNWWEKTFLENMFGVIRQAPSADVVVGNELIWRETESGAWENTGTTIWSFDGTKSYVHDVIDLCGSAKLCNSSMLVRLTKDRSFKTPDDIPVDVTEHFRERLFSLPFILLGTPLVNYAETIATARTKGGPTWGIYQVLLIGSVFIALPDAFEQQRLADKLWKSCGEPTSPRAVSLVSTGVFIREARSLLIQAPLIAKLRFLINVMRRPSHLKQMISLRTLYSDQLQFLVHAPLTQLIARVSPKLLDKMD
jgi:Glycosyl transferase family 2